MSEETLTTIDPTAAIELRPQKLKVEQTASEVYRLSLVLLVDLSGVGLDGLNRRRDLDRQVQRAVEEELANRARGGWPLLQRVQHLRRQYRAARRREDGAAQALRRLRAEREHLLASEPDGFGDRVVQIDAEVPGAEREVAAAQAAVAVVKKPLEEAEKDFRGEVISCARRLGGEALSRAFGERRAAEAPVVEALRGPLTALRGPLTALLGHELTLDGLKPHHVFDGGACVDPESLPEAAAPTPQAVGAEAVAGEPALASA
jgi:hypothetical protein